MKARNIIFITVLSLLVVTVSLTITFFVLDSRHRSPGASNNSSNIETEVSKPEVFNISELSLALFKTNYKLPLDEGYDFTFEWDSDYLFIEDGYICPFNSGSTFIFITAKYGEQTFLHTIAISIYEITPPYFDITSTDENNFALSITSCPALSCSTISFPELDFLGEMTKTNTTIIQLFKTNKISTSVKVSYTVKLDNYSETFEKELTATQEYIANLTHKHLYIIDNNFVTEANEQGYYNSSEFILTKDYNLENFTSSLIVEDPSILSLANNVLTPLKQGQTNVYVLLNGEKIFNEQITVTVIEAESVSVDAKQYVGNYFKVNITPCYASTIIKYDSLYLTHVNGSFLPELTGSTTLTIYSGNKSFTRDITISFSQTSANEIIDKDVNYYILQKQLSTWFTLKLINEENSIYNTNQEFEIFISSECLFNSDYAPSYDFKFNSSGTFYIVVMVESKIYAVYEVTIV